MDLYLVFIANTLLGVLLLLFLKLNIGSIRAKLNLSILAIAVWVLPYHLLKSAFPAPVVFDAYWLGSIVPSKQSLLLPESGLILNNLLSLDNLIVGLFGIGIVLFIRQIIRYSTWLHSLKKGADCNQEFNSCHGKSYAVCLSPKVQTGLISGFFNPIIWLNPELIGTPQHQLIMAHETQHIENWDHWKLLLLEFIRSMYWWNPLVRLLINEVVLLLEIRCDFQASKSFGTQKYQNGLAELILQTPGMNNHRFVNSMNGNKNTNIKRLKNLNKDQTMNLSSKLSYSIICLSSILILSLPFADIGANEQPAKTDDNNNGLLLDFEITIISATDTDRVETESVNVSIWTHFDVPASIRLGDKWALELMIFDHAENFFLDMTLFEQGEVVADPKIMAKIGVEASIKLGGGNNSLEVQVTAHKKPRPDTDQPHDL